MTWALLMAGAALVAAVPFLAERVKSPVAKRAGNGRRDEFAVLSRGPTRYRWEGPPGGPVVVMVHGLVTPSWVFDGLAPGLAMLGYRVLRYDLYGRGLSARPRGVLHDRGLYTTQLCELLDAQGIDAPVTLLGYSMGGAIATAFAAKAPERVERLILLAPAGLDYRPAPLLARSARLGLPGDWLWLAFGGAYLRRAARETLETPSAVAHFQRRLAGEVASRGYLPAILSSERQMLHETQEAEHHAIAEAGIPVLAIWGERDATIPASAMGKLAQWNRNARHEAVRGAGHGLAHTHPRQILAAIGPARRA